MGKVESDNNSYREPSKEKKKKRQSQASKHALIIDMKLKGCGAPTIADAVNMPIGTVQSIIARFKPVFSEIENIGEYRASKADLLSAGQLAALKSALSGNKLAKAGFLSTLQGFDILNKAERLENNQSTENHSHAIFGKLTIAESDK